MDNPIINSLIPHVTAGVPRRLTLDTYGPSYLPDGAVVLHEQENGVEVELDRHPITSVSKAQFVGWFSDATKWLDQHMKLKGL